MTGTAPRYLYLARHGEATPDESALSERGRSQAWLLGERLRGSSLAQVHHGPLPQVTQTAQLIGERLDGVPLHATESAGDYLPYLPRKDELPAASADAILGFLTQFPAEQRARGPQLAQAAVEQFTGPVAGDTPRHELLVTHAFLIGWLVRAALDAPKWRWIGISPANAALTVIRYAPGRPDSVLFFNDTGHLPPDLRWTGYPPELHL
ncbi:histidine phosphatase family protein [Nocardia suismassiliense]|uniref:Histidine phosphatase family protein n=1 Tax=Nocardia suismassiliense TaxID=2077092 RepID=A0ABW6QPC9_9NOCA|nr:histidine phosphatase family protein [Nocardia sp. XZ_19_369]